MDQRIVVYLRFRNGELIDTRQEIIEPRQMWSTDGKCLEWGYLTNDTFTMIVDGKIYRSWTLEWLEDRVLLHFVYPDGKTLEMMAPRIDEDRRLWASILIDKPIRLEKVPAFTIDPNRDIYQRPETEIIDGYLLLEPIDDFSQNFTVKSDDGRWMMVYRNDIPVEILAGLSA